MALKAQGVSIPKMALIVKQKRRWIINVVLVVVTLGFYALYLLASVFRSMNDHLMNQWVYETELQDYVKSNGVSGFQKGPYSVAAMNEITDMQDFARDVRDNSRGINSPPVALLIAVLFMIAMCGTYVLSIEDTELFILSAGICPVLSLDYLMAQPSDLLIKFALLVVNLVLMLKTAISLFGVTSRNSQAWRKVCENCITFIIPLWGTALLAGGFGESGIFGLNPYIATGLVFDVLILMLVSYSIKRYFTPGNDPVPRTRYWVRFLITGKSIEDPKALMPKQQTFEEFTSEKPFNQRTVEVIDKDTTDDISPHILAIMVLIIVSVPLIFYSYFIVPLNFNWTYFFGLFVPLIAIPFAWAAMKYRGQEQGVVMAAFTILLSAAVFSVAGDPPAVTFLEKLGISYYSFAIPLSALIMITVFAGNYSVLRENSKVYSVVRVIAIAISALCAFGSFIDAVSAPTRPITIINIFDLAIFAILTYIFYMNDEYDLHLALHKKGTVSVNKGHRSKSRMLNVSAALCAFASICFLASLTWDLSNVNWDISHLSGEMVLFAVPAMIMFITAGFSLTSTSELGPASDVDRDVPLLLLGVASFSLMGAANVLLWHFDYPDYMGLIASIYNPVMTISADFGESESFNRVVLLILLVMLVSCAGLYYSKSRKRFFKVLALFSLIWISVVPTGLSLAVDLVSRSFDVGTVLWLFGFMSMVLGCFALAQTIANYCNSNLSISEWETEALRLKEQELRNNVRKQP